MKNVIPDPSATKLDEQIEREYALAVTGSTFGSRIELCNNS